MSTPSLVLKSRDFLIFILLSYALVVSLFIDGSQRNYLVLFAAILGGFLFLVFGLALQRQAFWAFVLFAVMAMRANFLGGVGELASVALTFVYALGYFAVAGLLDRVQDKRTFVQDMMRWIIYAFAILSILQMVASIVGLPIPNLILSKGLLSYNSFAMEPSHLGRIVGVTMLCYVMLLRLPTSSNDSADLPKIRKKVVTAFLITMLLSGSSLAAVAIAAVFVLSRSLVWVIALVAISILIWPVFLLIDYEPIQRVTLLLANLGSLDVASVLEADHSGGIRVAPLLIYLSDASAAEPGFWFGYGSDGLRFFFLDRIPGLGDTVGAGFIPGFPVVYGTVITAFFVWVFIVLRTNATSAPLVGFFIVFMSFSAWNAQVFWYGLILIQITYTASRDNAARLGSRAS